ncbi:MAG: hypothetical protein PGN07_08205 [Aeromicrobium erythreum]
MNLRTVLSVGGAALVVAAATTAIAAPAEAASKPSKFPDRSVSITRGVDSLTISWPRIRGASKYAVVLAASNKFRNTQTVVLPTDPRKCYRTYCRRYDTTKTSITLSSSKLSISGAKGNTVSSSLGSLTSFKVFAINSKGWSRTGDASWKYRSSTTTKNWTPALYSDMPAPRPAVEGVPIKISSFNVLAASATTSSTSSTQSWAKRRNLVADQINATGASIVGTQEASHGSTNVPSRKTQFADLLDALNARSPGPWALADDASGRRDPNDWGNLDQNGDPKGLYNNSNQAVRIYYKSDVWDKAAHGAFLTGDVDRRGYDASDAVHKLRMVSWVKLIGKTPELTGRSICVLDAHLHTNLGNYTTADANRRALETQQILTQLNKADSHYNQACAGVPAAFTGDFNVSQFHPPYGNKPIVDLVTKAPDPVTGQTFIDTKNAAVRTNTRWTGTGKLQSTHQTYGTQIDYILTRGMGGATEFKVNVTSAGDQGSDHFPVTATVSLPASS